MASEETACYTLDHQTGQGAGGASPFFGGIKMCWGSEAASLTENEPGWRQIRLKAWDFTADIVVNNQMMADWTLQQPPALPLFVPPHRFDSARLR